MRGEERAGVLSNAKYSYLPQRSAIRRRTYPAKLSTENSGEPQNLMRMAAQPSFSIFQQAIRIYATLTREISRRRFADQHPYSALSILLRSGHATNAKAADFYCVIDQVYTFSGLDGSFLDRLEAEQREKERLEAERREKYVLRT